MSELKALMCLNADINTEALYEEGGNISTGTMNDVPSALFNQRT
jgi:hypothetical protein